MQMSSICMVMVLIILSAVTLGCSGAQPQSPPAAAQSPAEGPSSNVVISGFSFNPRELTIAAGTSVTWTNHEPTKHTVVSDDGKFESTVMAQGQSWSHTFSEAGTFSYYCGIHPGMKGTIIVEG